MRHIPKLAIVLCMAGASCFGATWRGARLLDAGCYDQNGKVSHIARMCAPTASTTDFAMKTRNGRVYKLDAPSNQKAQQAFENGAMKTDRHGAYRATVTGKRDPNNFITVSSIGHGGESVY